MLNEPRNDLAKGVRRLSTTTASRATCQDSNVQGFDQTEVLCWKVGCAAHNCLRRIAADRGSFISITEKNWASEPWAMERRAIDAVLTSYRQTTAGDWRCRPAEKPGLSGAIVWCIETEAGPDFDAPRMAGSGTDDRERIRALHRLHGPCPFRGHRLRCGAAVTADSGSTLIARAGRLGAATRALAAGLCGFLVTAQRRPAGRRLSSTGLLSSGRERVRDGRRRSRTLSLGLCIDCPDGS